MNLAEIIAENQRKGQAAKNQELVRLRIKELVNAYPDQVRSVLNLTGVHFTSKLPPSVLYAILLKNIHTNEELRDAISKMLAEMDGYLGADGQWAGIIGSSLTAIGSVVSSVGRGQYEHGDNSLELQKLQLEKEQQLAAENAKKRRTTWLIFGVSAALITGLIVFYKMRQNAKVATKLTPVR